MLHVLFNFKQNNMKRIFFSASFLIFSFTITAQSVDFESFNLPLDTFNNGSDLSGGFTENEMFFFNSYDSAFGGFWDGFSISTMRNDTTAGIGNQYSSITVGGYLSGAYAVAYPPFSGDLDITLSLPTDVTFYWEGLRITNSTYAYLSMLNGDGFAKKFGGLDGTDPDFFRLKMFLLEDTTILDSAEFTLADFTFSDSLDDYIVDSWIHMDLSGWPAPNALTTSIAFELSSSDVSFGFINTPTYFCLDAIEYSITTSITEEETSEDLRAFANGKSIQISSTQSGVYEVYNMNGQLVVSGKANSGQTSVSMSRYTSGAYLVKLSNDNLEKATKLYIP